MGSLYAILGIVGVALIGLSLLVFGIEGDKKYRLQLAGGLFVFLALAILLWYGVRAFLTPV